MSRQHGWLSFDVSNDPSFNNNRATNVLAYTYACSVEVASYIYLGYDVRGIIGSGDDGCILTEPFVVVRDVESLQKDIGR